MRLDALSYRVRVPLTIMVVIVLTEAVVAMALVSRAYLDARHDLEAGAMNLAAVLARSLREPMLRDDLWGAFEVVRTPVAVTNEQNLLENVVVLDSRDRVYVASDPARFSLASGIDTLPAEFQASINRLHKATPFDFAFSRDGLVAEIVSTGLVVADDGTSLGVVILSFDADRFYKRIKDSLVQLALISVPGFVILIGLGWFWGNRLTRPLTQLTDAMRRVGREPPSTVAALLPAAQSDEIGVLTQAFGGMLVQLERNQNLEREVVTAERLAAVGRVAAGIAHEINNPLGGMLNAVDTLTTHGNPDHFTAKTLGLLHRGLSQIRTTVGALLVEARLDSPAITPADWDDLRLLVDPDAASRRVSLEWRIEQHEVLPLPAHQVRQLALNLLLNAIKAAGEGGLVLASVQVLGENLRIQVTNGGETIAEDALAELFEPFAQSSVKDGKRSFGIGLWVCYQIVREMSGVISAASANRVTTFTIALPFGATQEIEACTSAESA